MSSDEPGATPGLLFGCVHAEEAPEGCGTTAACAFCGADEAIRYCRESGLQTERECTIRTQSEGHPKGLNYRVVATPFSLSDSPYVLLEFEDISGEKQHRALERVFYHDILNTATGLQVYLDLLKTEVDSDEGRNVIDTLAEISSSLVEEINSQRMLTSAESGTLEVEHALVDSRESIEQVVARLAPDALSRGVTVSVHPMSVASSIITDPTILRRVLMNAVKNAVEASGRGDTVELSAKPEGDRVVILISNPTPMEEDVQHQIFNRFYSTKGPNRGLGTYSMLVFIESYLRGAISFESNEETGTTFRIELPQDIRS